jgi:molybdopterin-guanine dinucleotide biosynthesis adapter protein
MIPIVRVVGKSGVGKTYVIERVVAELKRRRYRVATIKHSISGFDIDHEGKDTWRYAQAGSDTVAISSAEKFAIIRKIDHDYTLAELQRFIGPDFDIIVSEGFKQEKAQKIEVHRKEFGPDLLCTKEELLAIATDEKLEIDVPQYGLEDAAGLADFIEKRFFDREKEDTVSLFVNEEMIPVNPFVRSIISKTMAGMVSALKKVSHATSIDISIRRKSEE